MTKLEELMEMCLDGEGWKPLRFTVYNFLEEHEFYQLHLKQMGYESNYDDLECKMIGVENSVAVQFKNYIEQRLQSGKPVVTVCIIGDMDFLTVVKPKSAEISSILKK